ncbi:unnamed protein product [Chrysoparadoxa australica]
MRAVCGAVLLCCSRAFVPLKLLPRQSPHLQPMRSSVASYAEGQDLSELFDLYQSPQELGVQPGPPMQLDPPQSKKRSLVHRDGDWHRAVHIWLMNNQGEIVMQKRSPHKDTYPGMWDVSVGGHMTSGDDSMVTAQKELEEELGLTAAPENLKFLFTVATSSTGETASHGAFKDNEFKDVYVLKYNGSTEDLRYAPGEVSAVKWEGWRDVRDKILHGKDHYIKKPAAYCDALFTQIEKISSS